MEIIKITGFINEQDYSLKNRAPNPRFVDQKCTPDVLSFIAIIPPLLDSNTFTVKDVWQHKKFNQCVTKFFNKPDAKDLKAAHEYDKFIAQNLNLLAYSGILYRENHSRPHTYKILNTDLLEYIGQSDRNAFVFLNLYFMKFIKDNKLMSFFDSFFKHQDENSTTELKEGFTKFMQFHTKIGSRTSNGSQEIRRILPKVVNILAVHKSKKGLINGIISNELFQYRYLLYNRKNFRDVGKSKEVTRREQVEKSSLDYIKNSSGVPDTNLQIAKAKSIIKKLHRESEIQDQARGNTTHIHHIFPKHIFSELSTHLENLIALTAGQHLDYAHPNGNTREINLDYQRICLLVKSKTIEQHLKSGGTDYIKNKFIHVVNKGLKLYDTENELPIDSSFNEIEKTIVRYYQII